MPVGDFLDTNVLIYAASDHPTKTAPANELIRSGATVSVQVLNEFASAMTRKHGASFRTVRDFLGGARRFLTVVPLTEAEHDQAVRLVERHRLQFWDALIIASALSAGCARLLTEDMHAGLVVEGRLTIVNPFAVSG